MTKVLSGTLIIFIAIRISFYGGALSISAFKHKQEMHPVTECWNLVNNENLADNPGHRRLMRKHHLQICDLWAIVVLALELLS